MSKPPSWLRVNFRKAIDVWGDFLDHPVWVSVRLGAPIALAVCMVFSPPFDNPWRWVAFGVGIVVGFVALLLDLALRERASMAAAAENRRKEIEKQQAATQILALRDGIQPVAEMLADLVSDSARGESPAAVARQACNGLVLCFKKVEGVRAVCYKVSDNEQDLEVLARFGRVENVPEPFEGNTRRGKAAFQMLEQGVTVYVEDVADKARVQETVGAYFGKRESYATFISAPIVSKSDAYGMLTVDAPKAGDFLESEQHLVSMFANLLAVSFASERS